MAGRNTYKQNNPLRHDVGESCLNVKKFADEQDADPGIEPVVDPVVVEDALAVVAPHVRDVRVVVVQRGRATYSVSRAIQITIPRIISGLNFIWGC